ncbi:unnamed protein product [Enterobius vermicularis]|uniref:Ribosome biogenesis protein BRX1 homolog n=1 Tax=Enterobius vermicularis TaxID=51028 RepID=A0A0N4V198_ENTVE|nr:unnamed protein product [Enterobius vermicularis]
MGKLKRIKEKVVSLSDDDSDCTIEGSPGISETRVRALLLSFQIKSKWFNRERILIFCSRGSSYHTRHLMNDIKCLLPQSRSENKLDKSLNLTVINELAEIKNCTKCLYFENRKHTDTYLWMSNVASGPSVKFLVHNIHTMDELRLSGNCLRASRPVLSFSHSFNKKPHFALIKELIKQVFAVPDHHPKSQPFIDHVFSFSLTPNGKIWFRNFQIVDEKLQLQEIGPRVVMELICILDGSFEGAVLYDNSNYVSPNMIRRQFKKKALDKYVARKNSKLARKERAEALNAAQMPDPLGEIFNTDRVVTAPKAKKLRRIIEKKRRKAKKRSQSNRT